MGWRDFANWFSGSSTGPGTSRGSGRGTGAGTTSAAVRGRGRGRGEAPPPVQRPNSARSVARTFPPLPATTSRVIGLMTDDEVDRIFPNASPDYQVLFGPNFRPMHQIVNNLYLTGAFGLTVENFERCNIQAVINSTLEAPNIRGYDCLRIAIDDEPTEDMTPFFDLAADKINDVALNGGSTVVHCVAGVSRSAALVIAYLIKYKRMTLVDAFNLTRSRRPVIRPNNGFFRQLIQYERRYLGANSTRMVRVQLNPNQPTKELPEFFLRGHPDLMEEEGSIYKTKNNVTKDTPSSTLVLYQDYLRTPSTVGPVTMTPAVPPATTPSAVSSRPSYSGASSRAPNTQQSSVAANTYSLAHPSTSSATSAASGSSLSSTTSLMSTNLQGRVENNVTPTNSSPEAASSARNKVATSPSKQPPSSK